MLKQKLTNKVEGKEAVLNNNRKTVTLTKFRILKAQLL